MSSQSTTRSKIPTSCQVVAAGGPFTYSCTTSWATVSNFRLRVVFARAPLPATEGGALCPVPIADHEPDAGGAEFATGNWAEGCHCTIDHPPPGCNKRPGGQGPPHWVGAHAFGEVMVGSKAATVASAGAGGSDSSSVPAAEEKWAGLMTMQLVRPGGYNLSVLTTTSTAGGVQQQQQQQIHFAHREEPKLLWMWSETRKEYVASHLFNVVEKGGPTVVNWKSEDSWVHAQPLRLPADF